MVAVGGALQLQPQWLAVCVDQGGRTERSVAAMPQEARYSVDVVTRSGGNQNLSRFHCVVLPSTSIVRASRSNRVAG